MSLPRKLILGLALAALLLVGAFLGWRLYRAWTRPDIAKVGGTVLVYEVDPSRWPDGQPPPDYDPRKLAEGIKQRLDPADLYGMTVRPAADNRVEITLPRSGGDPAERVAKVKQLMASVGALEFRILANTDDDKEGIETAQRYFDAVEGNKAELERLRAADLGGDPPVPPAPPDHKAFRIRLGNEEEAVTYSWIELGPAERHFYGLANDQESNPFWQELADARKGYKAVLHDSTGGRGTQRTNLFYSREVVNPERLAERDRDKKYEYFILCRDPKRDENGRPRDLSSDSLVRAYPIDDGRGGRAVGFAFNSRGAALLAELTTKNKGRQLAIVLDDVIQSAPNIETPITGGTGIISGNFTADDVDRMVNILRAGALPATLKPVPVAEITVEPRK
jgi:hypothetical protein